MVYLPYKEKRGGHITEYTEKEVKKIITAAARIYAAQSFSETAAARIYAAQSFSETLTAEQGLCFTRFFAADTGKNAAREDARRQISAYSQAAMHRLIAEEIIRLKENREFFTAEAKRCMQEFFLAQNAEGFYYFAPTRLIEWPEHRADLHTGNAAEALESAVSLKLAADAAQAAERGDVETVLGITGDELLRKSIAEEDDPPERGQ